MLPEPGQWHDGHRARKAGHCRFRPRHIPRGYRGEREPCYRLIEPLSDDLADRGDRDTKRHAGSFRKTSTRCQRPAPSPAACIERRDDGRAFGDMVDAFYRHFWPVGEGWGAVVGGEGDQARRDWWVGD